MLNVDLILNTKWFFKCKNMCYYEVCVMVVISAHFVVMTV